MADMCCAATGHFRRGWIRAIGICLPALFPPMMKPTESNIGSFCSIKAITKFSTPGTRLDYAEPDPTMSSGLAFAREPMTLAVSDLDGGPTPGSAVNPNALYALPVFSLFPYVLSGVALGNARACLNDYVDIARHRASTYNRA